MWVNEKSTVKCWKNKKPAFKFKTPNLGGGGGAIDPFTGIVTFVLTAIGAVRLITRKKSNE